MSRASYKKNPDIKQFVYWRYVVDGKVLLKSVHINNAKTKDEAQELCRKTIYWADFSGFEITYVRTVVN